MRNGTTTKQNDDGRGVPVTRIETISDGTIDPKRVRFADMDSKDIERWRLLSGDILLSHINSVDHIGKAAIYNGQPEILIHGMNLMLLRPDQKLVLPTFLHYALRSESVRSHIRSRCKRAINQASINQKELSSIAILVPALSEQQTAVELLARAESIVRMGRESEQKAREIIPALFLDMFGDPATNARGWKRVPFELITHRITYGFTCPMKHWPAGIPIITAKNVLEGRIDFDDVHFASKAEFDALTAKSKPSLGDILVTKDGTIGRCAAVEDAFSFCINQSVALIKPKGNKVLPEFVVGFLGFPSILESLQSMGKGQALKHLQITELAKRLIPLPPLEIQQDYAARMQSIKAIGLRQTYAATAASEVFQSLLAGVFGET
jgi:type I restriction enzyme, S subunit